MGNEMTETHIGRFKVLEELGHGAFGTVYRALDTALNVERAIKILNPLLLADKHYVDSFMREASLTANLRHRSITKVHEALNENGRLCIVMDHMPGGSLADRLKKDGAMSLEIALPILRQLVDALNYAHGKGVVHCDIKPQNILFDDQGDPYLSDFGLAKSANTATISSVGDKVGGTLAYMSPELFDNTRPNTSSDVYALACVVYEMLTGKVLFDGGSSGTIIKQHISGANLEDINNQKVKDVLSSALNREPDQRLTAKDLIDQLEEIAKADKITAELQAKDLTETDEIDKNLTPAIGKISRNLPALAGAGFLALMAFFLGRAVQPSVVSPSQGGPPLVLNSPAPPVGPTVPSLVTLVRETVVVKETVQVINSIIVTQTVEMPKTVVVPQTVIVPQTVVVSANVPVRETVQSPVTEIVRIRETVQVPVTVIVPVPITSTVEVESPTQKATLTALSRQNSALFLLLTDKDSIKAIKTDRADYGGLEHSKENIAIKGSAITAANFVVEVRFFNPFFSAAQNPSAVWDWGVIFRTQDGNDGYRLYISSDKSWRMEYMNQSVTGKITSLFDLTQGVSNSFRLVVIDGEAWFSLNNTLVDKIDVSALQRSGKIYVGTAFQRSHDIPGATTRYTDFSVWLLN